MSGFSHLTAKINQLASSIQDEPTRQAISAIASEISRTIGDQRGTEVNTKNVVVEGRDRRGSLVSKGVTRMSGEVRTSGDVAWGTRVFLLDEAGGGDVVRGTMAAWNQDTGAYERMIGVPQKIIRDPLGRLTSNVADDVVTAMWDTSIGVTGRSLGTDRQGEYVSVTGVGAQGQQGGTGSQGSQGGQGPQGADGLQGNEGAQGPQGYQGYQGDQGDAGGPQGPQGYQGDQGPQGDKMAIVEYLDGYVGLFCVESPDVAFEDVMIVGVGATKIDQRFLAVCELGSIEVVGVSCNKAGELPATYIVGDTLCVDSAVKGRFVVKLRGIRKGRSGVRFPPKTRSQMERNNRFWNRAHAVDSIYSDPRPVSSR